MSTTEISYDEVKRVARKSEEAGKGLHLAEWDDMVHVFPMLGLGEDWPEVDEVSTKMSAFIEEKPEGKISGCRMKYLGGELF